MGKETVCIKAPAKINLGLDITGRRKDGYHLVKMVMQTVSLYDEVTVKRTSEGVDMELFTESEKMAKANIPVDEKNLCIKAALIMKEKYGLEGGFHITLKKVIPSEAGLAGGSSDAAATMKAIRELHEIDASDEELMELALNLGADIPYCIMQGTALAEGIGEILTKLPDMQTTDVVLVKPDVAVSTAEAYKAIDSASSYAHPNIDEIVKLLGANQVEDIGVFLGNVFEDMVIKNYPEIHEIKQELRENKSIAELMSGSGSCVYGLFRNEEDAKVAERHFKETYPNYQVFRAKTV